MSRLSITATPGNPRVRVCVRWRTAPSFMCVYIQPYRTDLVQDVYTAVASRYQSLFCKSDVNYLTFVKGLCMIFRVRLGTLELRGETTLRAGPTRHPYTTTTTRSQNTIRQRIRTQRLIRRSIMCFKSTPRSVPCLKIIIIIINNLRQNIYKVLLDI